MRRTASVGAGLLLVLALIAASFAGGAGAASGGTFVQTTGIDPDRIVLRADLRGSGDATWQIEHRIRLDDDNATAAFDSLQADVQENRSAYEARFENRMRTIVGSAENATGRDMAVRNVSVSTTRTISGDEDIVVGIVRYQFDWTGFAAATDERVIAGDAIAGLVLDRNTTLQFQWPREWDVSDLSPPTEERRPGVATWSGPVTFTPNEPRLVLSTTAPTETPTATPTASPTVTTTDDSTITDGTSPTVTPTERLGERDEGSIPFGLIVGVLVVLALLGIGAWLGYNRDGGLPFGIEGGSSESGGGSSTATSDGEADSPPEELLSNEERVLKLLEEKGGRMKQQEVVSELGWTDAKTSQVVGTLREEEEIEVFRIGRENVLALPGESDF